MKSILFLAVASIGVSTAAVGQTQKIVVPAYFDLSVCSDSTRACDWARIQAAGSRVRVVVALGGSPGGFQTLSGDQPGQPLYNARAQFNANRSAGQLVLGYVDTNPCVNSGCIPLDERTVLNDVNSGVKAWYGIDSSGVYHSNQGYKDNIDGIFYDDGPGFSVNQTWTDGQFQSYYQGLYLDTKNLVSSTFSGKTMTIMLNASQYPSEWVLSGPAGDLATMWEESVSNYINTATFKAIGPGGNYATGQNPPTWWSTRAGNIAHVVSGATGDELTDLVGISRDSTHGTPNMLYQFDRPPHAKYAGIACFFEEEIHAMYGEYYTSHPPLWCRNNPNDINSGSCCPTVQFGGPVCYSDGTCGIACDSGYHSCVDYCQINGQLCF